LNTALMRPGKRVTVTAPARLHLGFLDLNGHLGRRFGSIGLAISGLKTRISVAPAEHVRVSGPESDRVRRYLELMRDTLGPDHAYDVKVEELVPAHAGFGSGTQLALAVGAALRRLHALPLDLRGDAVRLGRGDRSGAGIGLFQHGGFVVDGGRKDRGGPAPIISHLPFPERWRVLVVLDTSRQGVHGTDETNAFAKLPPPEEADVAHLCHVLVMQLLPAVAEADLAGFGAALEEIQERLGDYFAPAQGGNRYASLRVAATLDLIRHAGGVGIGQSSWGPTGYAFAESSEAAQQIVHAVSRQAQTEAVDIRVCKGLNTGAEITEQALAQVPQS
jgi:beta-ribofuranosylaminobenzene 5'-phosphate synthase